MRVEVWAGVWVRSMVLVILPLSSPRAGWGRQEINQSLTNKKGKADNPAFPFVLYRNRRCSSSPIRSRGQQRELTLLLLALDDDRGLDQDQQHLVILRRR